LPKAKAKKKKILGLSDERKAPSKNEEKKGRTFVDHGLPACVFVAFHDRDPLGPHARFGGFIGPDAGVCMLDFQTNKNKKKR
jgi:hypothetical protein